MDGPWGKGCTRGDPRPLRIPGAALRPGFVAETAPFWASSPSQCLGGLPGPSGDRSIAVSSAVGPRRIAHEHSAPEHPQDREPKEEGATAQADPDPKRASSAAVKCACGRAIR